MTSHVGLTVALLAALFSNAILLFMLILQSSNLAILKCQLQTRLDINHSSGNHFSDYNHGQMNPDFDHLQNRFSETQDGQANSASSNVWEDKSSDERQRRLEISNQPPQKQNNQRRNVKDDYVDVLDNHDFFSRVEKHFSYFMNYFRQRNDDLFLRWKNSEKRSNGQDLLLGKIQSKENVDNETFTNSTDLNSSGKDSDAEDDDVDGSDANFVDSSHGESRSSNSQTPRQLLSLKRHRRGADAPVNKTSAVGGPASHRLHEVFSTFSDSELAKFDAAVYDLLVPALVHFETITIR